MGGAPVKIAVLALGSHGDIQPYAYLGKGLLSAVHGVHFVTTQDFGALIDGYGLAFHPIPSDAKNTINSAGASMMSLTTSQTVGDSDMGRRAEVLGSKLEAEDGITRAVEIIEGLPSR